LSLLNELKRRNVFRVGTAYVVLAWLIIQVVETIFPVYGMSDGAIRLVVTLLAIGLIPVVILAWAFELTPEGFKKDKDVDRSQSVSLQSGKKLDRTIMVVLALALGYFAFDKFVLDPVEDVQIAESAHQEGRSAAFTESIGDKSIAVMPFTNLSAESSNQFFADGIHDDLLTRISSIQDIKTISRSSVMTYRNSNKSLRSIAKELNVTTILEGGVQRAGDQVRINLQLIDAESDAHLWAQTYTRELTATNVFVIQAEITEAVASALEVILSEDQRRQLARQSTANLQALDAYFLGNQLFSQATSESIGQAIMAYQAAIRFDPEFDLAYSKQALVILEQIWINGLSSGTQLKKSRPLIDRAILLNPQSSLALTALGQWYSIDGQTDKAEQTFIQALVLEPNNVEAITSYGKLLQWGKFDPASAVNLFRRAVELDPQNADNKISLAGSMGRIGLGDEAIQLMEDLVADHPGSANIWRTLAELFTLTEYRHDKALKSLREAYELDPKNPRSSYLISEICYRLGDFYNAALWLNHAANLSPTSELASVFRGWAFILQGNFEGAREEFGSSTSDSNLYWHGIFRLAKIDVATGNPLDAINRYQNFAPKFDGRKTIENFFYGVGAINAYQEFGEHEKAQALTDEFMAFIEAEPPLFFNGVQVMRASLYAISGQTEAALAMLEDWVSQGGTSSMLQIQTEYELSVLANDPRYQSILRTVNNRLSEQKANLARWEASGEMLPMPREVTDPR
jgi:TolB-like protein/predicted Zn-dependent protease